ncbi:hypothetical protein TNCV_3655601 [Trichonephila clavipes]|nr:hypothetical protein TNCV_3655601 [Trichonephila clavipes]
MPLSCPWEKQPLVKSMPALLNVCPCDLLIVIAKLTLIGNSSLLCSKGKFDGIMGYRGTNTISPIQYPDIIRPSITFFYKDTTRSLVPLQSFGGFKLRSSMKGIPILSSSL